MTEILASLLINVLLFEKVEARGQTAMSTCRAAVRVFTLGSVMGKGNWMIGCCASWPRMKAERE
jgi:hypothetical protein